MVWDPIGEIISGEEVLSHPDVSPKTPFQFRRTSHAPPVTSVSSEHWQDHSPTPKDRRCYCIQVRVMLVDGGGNEPPLSHVMGGDLINDILQEAWLEDQITIVMVLSPREAILFFGRHSKNKGLPYHRARNIEFSLGGLFSWDGWSVQIEASKKTAQEGPCTLLKAVVEKRMKARGLGQPQGETRHPKTPAVAYDIEEWMWGLVRNSDGQPKWNDDMSHRLDRWSDCSWRGAKVEGGIDGRVPLGFLQNPWEIHLLWGK